MWESPRPEKYLPSKCSPRAWLPTGKCETVEQTICTSHCFLSSRVEKRREKQNPNFFHLGLLTGWLLTMDKCRSALFSASQIIQSTPTGKSKEWNKRPGRFRGNSSSGKPEEWSSSSCHNSQNRYTVDFCPATWIPWFYSTAQALLGKLRRQGPEKRNPLSPHLPSSHREVDRD